jgi:hypothetical protein
MRISKNITYPLIILTSVFIGSIFLFSCSSIFGRSVSKIDILDRRFSNKDGSIYIQFYEDKLEDCRKEQSNYYTYEINDNYVSVDGNNKYYFINDSTLFDFESKLYLSWSVYYE